LRLLLKNKTHILFALCGSSSYLLTYAANVNIFFVKCFKEICKTWLYYTISSLLTCLFTLLL